MTFSSPFCLRVELRLLFKMFFKCVFENVVAVAFQSVFHAEMHQNDVFLFFKNHF